MIALRHAWLQKHPTPAAAGGEFHWYPAAPDAADRELRARFAERLRGLEPPAVSWTLSPSRLAWAQVFAATAPSDGRRYVGLVLTIAEVAAPRDAATSALFAALGALPAPAPWTADLGEIELVAGGLPATAQNSAMSRARRAALAARRPSPQTTATTPVFASRATSASAGPPAARPDTSAAPRSTPPPDETDLGEIKLADARDPVGDGAAVVRALLLGGVAVVAAPASSELPLRVAAIEALLPAPRATIEGAFAAHAAEHRAGDRMAALAAAAWRAPASREAAAWRLACELAGARDAIDEVGAAIESLEANGARDALSAAERAAIGEARSVVEVLHAWGRGRLDGAGGASTLPARLAEVVALRALARLADGGDARGAIAEARWYALLPAARRAALMTAVAARAASLRPLATEVLHA